MGKHLNAVKRRFGTDTRGLLDGGRYALLHTRSMEFDELRPYVPGDDVRDIDWKASARSGSVLIKRFVTEKHHKILLVADAGQNMAALAPGGERKSTVAENVLGAIGLIALGRSDQIAMVYGDGRGSLNIGLSRGETQVERILTHYHDHAVAARGPSDICCQLDYVATHYRHRMLIVVVSDEPEPDARLDELTARLGSRHDLMWAMVADMPATAAGDRGGFDIATGRPVHALAAGDRRVIAAYRRAEQARAQRLTEFLTARSIAHATLTGSADLRRAIVDLTGVWSRAG
ncbi:DUF58 domain-containing protein [Mycolicibacterium poriferae]|uniref:DUF58 domain-containing protein n=1 Tax=Mycolicibacterium poriferae TaxID=39694 RepID=UPI0024B91944|nr:DUF58 domain-containing protein [Mycolicibacterium poriferae]